MFRGKMHAPKGGLPPDAVIMTNPTGALRAEDVLALSAGEMLSVEALVGPESVASARRLLRH